MIQASFDNFALSSVTGYRISGCLSEFANAARGLLLISLRETIPVARQFDRQIKINEPLPLFADLVMRDADRFYRFPNIELLSIHVGVTRRDRCRTFEFSYNSGGVAELRMALDYSGRTQLKENALGGDYDIAGFGGARHLLGFEANTSATSACSVRFVAARNSEDSFVRLYGELNNQAAARNGVTGVRFCFSRGDLDLSSSTLARVYVSETFGDFASHPEPVLDEVADMSADPETQVRSRVNDLTHEGLFRRDMDQHFAPQFAYTAESITFVFQPGYRPSLNLV